MLKSLSRLLIWLILAVGLTSFLAIYYWGKLFVHSPIHIGPIGLTISPIGQHGERQFTILDWSQYSNDKREDRFFGNCFVTRNKTYLNSSDAVVITNRKQFHFRDFPKLRHRWQRWVWILDENPFHPFSGNDFSFPRLRGLFNWTMTYRTNSDVYIPYGWTMRKLEPELIPDFIGKQSKLAAAVMSNCGSSSGHIARYKYVQELQKHISVDVYGACTGLRCEGYVYASAQQTGACPKVKEYLFYLAFENRNCREYISEKTFSHGFQMGAVPVVMGARKEDYIRITPPNCCIYASDFKSPKQLGSYLQSVYKNRTEYMEYQKWRTNFTTSYRIQFVQDEPLWKSLCNALVKDKGDTKIYADLAQYWTEADCEPQKN